MAIYAGSLRERVRSVLLVFLGLVEQLGILGDSGGVYVDTASGPARVVADNDGRVVRNGRRA